MNNLSDFANFGELKKNLGVGGGAGGGGGAPNGSLRPGRQNQKPSLYASAYISLYSLAVGKLTTIVDAQMEVLNGIGGMMYLTCVVLSSKNYYCSFSK